MQRNLLLAIFAVGLLLIAACASPDAAAPSEAMPSDAAPSTAPAEAGDAEMDVPVDAGEQKEQTMTTRELAEATNTAVIEIRGMSYDPRDAVLPVGTTVTFINEDQSDHSVTSDSFDSGLLARNGGTWQYTFTTPGVYDIHSLDYRTVKGTITVE